MSQIGTNGTFHVPLPPRVTITDEARESFRSSGILDFVPENKREDLQEACIWLIDRVEYDQLIVLPHPATGEEAAWSLRFEVEDPDRPSYRVISIRRMA